MGGNAPTGETLLAESDRAEATLQQRTQQLLSVIDDGAEIPVRADFEPLEELRKCKTGYSFYSRHDLGNVEGWKFPSDETEWRVAIGKRLTALGWSDVSGTSYGDGETDVTMLHLSYPEEVTEAIISFHPGSVADGVAIRITGTCQPGDYSELSDLRWVRARNS